MLNRVKNRKQEGFTIIEVLIVLAIAGLILLVVFLAVPALQRNSRNTQRKSDVAGLLGSAGEYVANNGGKATFTAADLTGNSKSGFYDTATAGVVTVGTKTAGAPLTVPTDTEKVVIYTNAKCGATPTAAPIDGNGRSYIAYYALEKQGSGSQPQCQDG